MGWFGDALRAVVTVAAIIPGPWQIAARIALVADGANRARRARSAAKAAQAAADYAGRQQSTRSASDVGRIIYGKDIVAGSLRYWQTTGDKGQFLHLVYIMAAHECDGIETVYFNDTPLPAADANGWITSGPYFESKSGEHQRAERTGPGTIVFTNPISSIVAVTKLSAGSDNSAVITTGYSFAGSTVTITDPESGATYWVDATYAAGTPRVRIRPFLGAAGQAAIADLVAESGGKWTSAHRLQGMCGVYVRIEYTPEMFGQVGIPEIKCAVRGHKILDPRTGSTVWTENSALVMAHYLKTYCGATAAEVPDAMVSAEATNCDQLVTLTAGGTTQKRYTCNASYSTEMVPRDILASIGETMASGVPAYAGGQFLIRAGVARTPTLTITNDMVVGAVSIQSAAKRSTLQNRVVVSYAEPSKIGVITEAPPVLNATYVTQDGGLDLPLYLTVEGCNDSMRAQRLGKISLDRARQGLRVSMQCTLDAYDALPGDWVSVTLDRYGWTAKTFEVLTRGIDLETGLINYSLQEIAAGVYDWNYGQATTVDLTPNTTLTNPLTPPAVLVLAEPVTGTAALQKMSDGTVISRALIAWTQSADVYVTRGGTIEVEWLYSADTAWNSGLSVPGDSVQAYIGPLTDGRSVLVRARAVNSAGRFGAWAYKAFVVIGKIAPPTNVAGLIATVSGGQALIAMDPCPDADYFETEVRVGPAAATWATATRLGVGNQNVFAWMPYPATGTYSVFAVHRDSSGNESSPQAIVATVTAAGITSAASGTNLLMNADFWTRNSPPGDPGRPYDPAGYAVYQAAYTVAGYWGWSDRAGRDGTGKAFALEAVTSAPAGSAGGRVGIATSAQIANGLITGGVSNGWRPGEVYTVSYWARVVRGGATTTESDITHVATTSGAAAVSGGGTVTVARPAGVAANDLLVIVFTFDRTPSGETFNVSGWTRIGSQQNQTGPDGQITTAWYKVATAGDAAAASFTIASDIATVTNPSSWVCTAYRGVDTASPIATTGAWGLSTTAGTTPPTAPGITTAGNTALVWIGATDQTNGTASTLSAPTGYTLRAQAQTGGSWNGIAAIADKLPKAANGTVPAVVGGAVTGGVTFGYVAVLLALRPATTSSGSGDVATEWEGIASTDLYWNTYPATSANDSDALTLSYQWRQFKHRITWGATVEGNGALYVGIRKSTGDTILPAIAAGARIEFDELMVSLGPDYPIYERSPQDDIRALSIVTAAISADAVAEVRDATGPTTGISVSSSFTPVVSLSFLASAAGVISARAFAVINGLYPAYSGASGILLQGNLTIRVNSIAIASAIGEAETPTPIGGATVPAGSISVPMPIDLGQNVNKGDSVEVVFSARANGCSSARCSATLHVELIKK